MNYYYSNYRLGITPRPSGDLKGGFKKPQKIKYRGKEIRITINSNENGGLLTCGIQGLGEILVALYALIIAAPIHFDV